MHIRQGSSCCCIGSDSSGILQCSDSPELVPRNTVQIPHGMKVLSEDVAWDFFPRYRVREICVKLGLWCYRVSSLSVLQHILSDLSK